jgi:hypothetical protein
MVKRLELVNDLHDLPHNCKRNNARQLDAQKDGGYPASGSNVRAREQQKGETIAGHVQRPEHCMSGLRMLAIVSSRDLSADSPSMQLHLPCSCIFCF